jgi:hypothetical protein
VICIADQARHRFTSDNTTLARSHSSRDEATIGASTRDNIIARERKYFFTCSHKGLDEMVKIVDIHSNLIACMQSLCRQND